MAGLIIPGTFAAGMVCLPLGWCVCRWAGAFAVGLVRLPFGWCICCWAGAVGFGLTFACGGFMSNCRFIFMSIPIRVWSMAWPERFVGAEYCDPDS